jgi:glycosyltransferase involved in cell wall biosynthesis
LIDAMRAVAAHVPAAEVVIAGNGPRAAALQRRAAEANARVRFLGRVTPDELRAWMARAQL